jgi:hypothetical protein
LGGPSSALAPAVECIATRIWAEPHTTLMVECTFARIWAETYSAMVRCARAVADAGLKPI